MKIQDLRAREIIDCKGKPLLEVDIITEDGTMGPGSVPLRYLRRGTRGYGAAGRRPEPL